MIRNTELKKWHHRDKENNRVINVLGVEYAYLNINNSDDLYVTKFGLPFIDLLQPDNYWTDREWFKLNSLRLSGSSAVYKIRTKKVNYHRASSVAS